MNWQNIISQRTGTSLYNDLRDLSILGLDVEGEPIGNRYHYHCGQPRI